MANRYCFIGRLKYFSRIECSIPKTTVKFEGKIHLDDKSYVAKAVDTDELLSVENEQLFCVSDELARAILMKDNCKLKIYFCTTKCKVDNEKHIIICKECKNCESNNESAATDKQLYYHIYKVEILYV